jgi:hypothetical protein
VKPVGGRPRRGRRPPSVVHSARQEPRRPARGHPPQGGLVARPPERTLSPMWTLFRFSLRGGEARAYGDALEILRGAGFRRADAGTAIDADAPFPVAVVADVRSEPADVTRAIFSALHEAGLHPVGVSGAPMTLPPPATVAARA